MKIRDLFVFSGQSNMMGASVYPASKQIIYQDSFEYLHKQKRLGAKIGSFQKTAFPVGEFSYKDMRFAYSQEYARDGRSLLNNYAQNTFFCPSMCNLKKEEEKSLFDFSYFSEANAPFATSLAPYIVQEWESIGRRCCYTHIAKGGVSINYYFNEEMINTLNVLIREYNAIHEQKLPMQVVDKNAIGAAEYFFEKLNDYFKDTREYFPNEQLKNKCFFWLQGESDAGCLKDLYGLYLTVLWERLKEIGFTHFFCIRVGFWTNDCIANIMKAQEEFCKRNVDAYMLTRCCSFMPTPDQNLHLWYGTNDITKYEFCRDSYFGFSNHHINERGFKLIAKAALKNLKRVLVDKLPVVLEDEKCLYLLREEADISV